MLLLCLLFLLLVIANNTIILTTTIVSFNFLLFFFLQHLSVTTPIVFDAVFLQPSPIDDDFLIAIFTIQLLMILLLLCWLLLR